MARSFVHTHVHSDYSLLDGAAKVDALVAAAVADGQPALALTDHGNLCGAIEFYQACRRAKVQPLLGIEAYLAPRSRHDRTANPVAAHHLILLAQDERGWRNLIKLSTRSFTEGFYYHPRIDKELLARHHEGLIVQSACLSGEPSYYARHGDLPRARRALGEMKDIFGDRYYVEVQRNGNDGQEEVNQALLGLARELGLPTVASADVHYVSADDAAAHEVRICISSGKTLDDPKRLKPDASLRFRLAAEMHELFHDLPDAARGGEEIASRCGLELPLGTLHLPAFEAPGGEDNVVYFRRLCREGAQARYGAPLPAAVEKRLAYEQGVIEQMGFVPYFLITWDFIRYAREQGIPVGPGRGSGAGSIVAYSLRITNVDPLKYDLLFERFLNPQRVSMPDFDIDFCRDGREKVIRYVQQRYGGPDRVSQIVTFGRMAARAVIRDVGRVLGIPLREVDALAKRIPNGPKDTLRGAIESDPDLKRDLDGTEEYRRLLDIALRLEGMNRNASKHAAGVVIADAPLEEYVPLYRVGTDLTTQFTMDDLEPIGLLKMDFLGLRTLTILAKALANVRIGGKEPPDLDHLPPDDPATFQMLTAGEALGVFQLESSGMRELLRQVRPDRFGDLSDIVALFRPGPMGSGMTDMYVRRKAGKEPVTYPHPSLEPTLRETRGVVVYQEQVMRVANVLAGFDLAEADNLRKAMGKKKPEEMAKYRAKFVTGCGKNGMAAAQAEEIWSQLEHFAGYGFNKSHTVAYAVVTYQTAYLKRHFPREFMAALLTCEMADMDKVSEYVEESRRMGIEVLPPDVNLSGSEFAVEGEDVRYGLSAVRGVGESAAEAIVAGRGEPDAQRPYRNVFDLCERVDHTKVPRTALEALVRAGAFDASCPSRARVDAALDRAFGLGAEVNADRLAGQMGLFGVEAATAPEPDYPDVPDWSDVEKTAFEREAIGYYATGHPLARHEGLLRRLSSGTVLSLADAPDRARVLIGGMVRAPRTTVVKSGQNEGKKMAFFTLEDATGTLDCVVFSRAFLEHGALVVDDRLVFAEGRVDRSRDKPSLQVDRLVPLEDAPRVLARGLLLRMEEPSADALRRVREILAATPGPLSVVLEFPFVAQSPAAPPAPEAQPSEARAPESRAPESGSSDARIARVKAGRGWSVEATTELLERLRALPEVSGAEFLARDP